MTDIVHEAQDTHLCALFIKAHGEDGDYEYVLDAANSAAKRLQVILAELPATSSLARDVRMFAKFVRTAQRNLSQQRPHPLLSFNPPLTREITKTPTSVSTGRGPIFVAGAGFEPTTSGL